MCTITVLAASVMVTGCATPKHNPRTAINLAPFLSPECNTSRMFCRTPLNERGDALTHYPRRFAIGSRAEGAFAALSVAPLAAYVGTAEGKDDRPKFPWPSPKRTRLPSFFLEFDPPVAEWPLEMMRGETTIVRAAMRVYDREGTYFTDGSATRRIRVTREEPIDVGESHYADCLRLHMETDLRFGWWCTVTVEEQTWLARGVGQVRRIEKIKGTALLLYRFSSAFEYTLMPNAVTDLIEASEQQAAPIEANSPRPAPNAPWADCWRAQWSRLVIHFDRGVPRPRIGGIVLELVAP